MASQGGPVVSPFRASLLKTPKPDPHQTDLGSRSVLESRSGGHAETAQRLFEEADTNRDGVISRTELTRALERDAGVGKRSGPGSVTDGIATGSVSRLAGDLESLLDLRATVLNDIQAFTTQLSQDTQLDRGHGGLSEVQSRLSESWGLLQQVDQEIKASSSAQ